MENQSGRKSLFNKAGDLLRSFDKFGESANFKVKGKSQSQSMCGAVISLLVLAITLSYAI